MTMPHIDPRPRPRACVMGILARAWEQTQQGERIKGPTPPDFLYRYDGPDPRPLD